MVNQLKASLTLLDSNLREMLLGSFVGFSVKLLSAISLFAMNLVVARTLGAAEAGLFFLGFTLVTMVAAVGRLGLDQSIVRFVAAKHATNAIASMHGVYRKSIIWVAVASGSLALIGWLCIDALTDQFFQQPGFKPVLHSIMLAIPLTALFTVQAHALQGLKRVAKSMLTLSVVAPLSLLAFMMVAPVDSAVSLTHYFNVSCAIALLVGLLFWFQSAPQNHGAKTFPSDLLRKTCMPLWAVAILSQVTQWSSQIMLGTWSSAESVAFFATAQRTAMLTSFVLFAVNAIAAPKFAAMYAQGDLKGLRHLAINSVRLMMVAAIPALSIMLLFPEWLMSFFGDDFRAASSALVILALGQFVNIATGSVGYLLSMTGHETHVRNNAIWSAVIAIVLGVILIPAYGLIGAAIATAVAIASQNLLGVYQVRKHLG
ncbi:MAG: oligosaccharide flippase family protein, partial [Pseudomonadota bacterium]